MNNVEPSIELQKKIDYLEGISGLKVSISRDKKGYYFTFSESVFNRTIKSMYTYPKAKIFAEGFKLGMRYGKQYG